MKQHSFMKVNMPFALIETVDVWSGYQYKINIWVVLTPLQKEEAFASEVQLPTVWLIPVTWLCGRKASGERCHKTNELLFGCWSAKRNCSCLLLFSFGKSNQFVFTMKTAFLRDEIVVEVPLLLYLGSTMFLQNCSVFISFFKFDFLVVALFPFLKITWTTFRPESGYEIQGCQKVFAPFLISGCFSYFFLHHQTNLNI